MNNRTKKPKSILALVMAIALLLTMGFPLQLFAASTMSDISDNWAKKEITSWVSQGLIKGYSDGTFKPNNNIIRAEFVALVNRLFKFSQKASVTFKDATPKNWFYDEIAKAEWAGYLSELMDGTFKLNENITRQEVAAIIYKLKALKDNSAEADRFKDASSMNPSFKGYIGAVAKAGYMKGYPDGKFGPANNLTRAEAVVALNNICGIVVEKIEDMKIDVGKTVSVPVKTKPSDAGISVKSSDESVVKTSIDGRDVKLTSLKNGAVTITVTAEKEVFPAGVATFAVVSGAVTIASPGSTPTVTPPPASKLAKGTVELATIGKTSVARVTVKSSDVGTAFRPAATQQLYTIGQTAQLEATSKTAIDFELLNASGNIVGKFTVNMKAGDFSASITELAIPAKSAIGNIKLAKIGNTDLAQIIVTSASVGTSFRLVGAQEVTAFGQNVKLETAGKTKADFELLNADDLLIGTFSVELKAGNFQVPVTEVALPEKSAKGTVALATIGTTDLAQITVTSASVGTSFRLVGSQEVTAFGQNVKLETAGKTKADFELLNAAGLVIGTFSVELKAGNFAAAIKDVALPVIKVDGTVELTTIGTTGIARITFKSATAGVSVRETGTQNVIAIGQNVKLETAGKTKISFDLLGASDTVLGTFEVPLTAGTFSATVK